METKQHNTNIYILNQ